MEFYDPVFVNDLSPQHRYLRCHWIDGVHLRFPIMMYRFAYGGNIGILCFAWRVPDITDQTKVRQNLQHNKESILPGV